MHDADFRQSERDWHSFVEKLTERLIEIDDTVPELPVKDIVGLTFHSSLQMHASLAHHTIISAGFPHLPGCPLWHRQNSIQGRRRPGARCCRPISVTKSTNARSVTAALFCSMVRTSTGHTTQKVLRCDEGLARDARARMLTTTFRSRRITRAS